MANSDQQQNQFRLRELLTTQTDKWLLSWLLGVITALSVIGLLMMSGWFISVAAVAGYCGVGLAQLLIIWLPAAIYSGICLCFARRALWRMMISHHAVFWVTATAKSAIFLSDLLIYH